MADEPTRQELIDGVQQWMATGYGIVEFDAFVDFALLHRGQQHADGRRFA